MSFLQKSASGPAGETGVSELERDRRRSQSGQGRIEQHLIPENLFLKIRRWKAGNDHDSIVSTDGHLVAL